MLAPLFFALHGLSHPDVCLRELEAAMNERSDKYDNEGIPEERFYRIKR
jgi:hypothetical protein